MATVTTIYGDMDESLLEKRMGLSGNGYFVEYWLNGELVHRSVTASITGVDAIGAAASFGGDDTPKEFDAYGQRWRL